MADRQMERQTDQRIDKASYSEGRMLDYIFHSEFVNIALFLSSLTKALRTDEPTNGPTDQRMDKASYRITRMLNYVWKIPSTVRCIKKQLISLFQRFWQKRYGPTNQPTNQRTSVLIEMRGRLLTTIGNCVKYPCLMRPRRDWYRPKYLASDSS